MEYKVVLGNRTGRGGAFVSANVYVKASSLQSAWRQANSVKLFNESVLDVYPVKEAVQ